jgi:sterol-4alpha-carboxylate 3-dehydrogenase (decarboxylating)
MSFEKPSLLVFGGCGFVGYHIVRHFVEDGAFEPVSVISRSSRSNNKNKVEGVLYYNGDIADRATIEQLVRDIKPTVIINAASPSPVFGQYKEYERVAIEGNRVLLQIAKESSHVRAVIYTSSAAVAKGYEHVDIDEDYPLANVDPKAQEYSKTKAVAEIMVCEAHRPPDTSISLGTEDWSVYLRTGAIRLPLMYGTHDYLSIPIILNVLEHRQQSIQLGDGKSMWSVCSTQNAAIGHYLLANALLDDKTAAEVSGEAFHIHDGIARSFWEIFRAVWILAGWDPRDKWILVIPASLAWALASFVETLYKIFTLGKMKPGKLTTQNVEYAIYTHTYNMNKAKRLIGYEPAQHYEEQLDIAVKWSLEYGDFPRILRKYGSVKRD